MNVGGIVISLCENCLARISASTRRAGLERGVRTTYSGARLAATDSAPQMQLRCSLSLPVVAALLLAAAAQQLPKSYAPVAITLPAASADSSFATFRAAIAAAAK